MVVTGVRWEESTSRKENQGIVTIADRSSGKLAETNPDFRATRAGGAALVNDNTETRRVIESCYKRHKTTVNPIIEWTDADIWEFIRGEGIPYCELYDDGFTRLGCIGCPMAGTTGREHEFLRWPKYQAAYLSAFEKMLKERAKNGKKLNSWRSSRDVFNWWMEYDVLPGQMSFDDYEEETT